MQQVKVSCIDVTMKTRDAAYKYFGRARILITGMSGA